MNGPGGLRTVLITVSVPLFAVTLTAVLSCSRPGAEDSLAADREGSRVGSGFGPTSQDDSSSQRAAEVGSEPDRTQRPRLRVRVWEPSPELVDELNLSDDQVDRIRANELDAATSLADLRLSERQASLRLIRNLGREPIDAVRIAAIRQELLDQAQMRLALEVTRVEKLRDILDQQQWRRLLELDTAPIRIGSFQPQPVVRVTVTGPDEDEIGD